MCCARSTSVQWFASPLVTTVEVSNRPIYRAQSRSSSDENLSDLARKAAGSASDFARVVRNLILDVRDSYRPELHYMRGPGPKWRAKHQPGLKLDSRAVLPAGRHQLLPLYVRTANLTR